MRLNCRLPVRGTCSQDNSEQLIRRYRKSFFIYYRYIFLRGYVFIFKYEKPHKIRVIFFIFKKIYKLFFFLFAIQVLSIGCKKEKKESPAIETGNVTDINFTPDEIIFVAEAGEHIIKVANYKWKASLDNRNIEIENVYPGYMKINIPTWGKVTLSR